MSVPPKYPIPHIVGDDEPETNAPISPDRQLETDSSLSDSSYEDDDDDVSSSSGGADWSMNVTRIAATPGRLPIYAAATPLKKSSIVVEEQGPILADKENAPPAQKMEVEKEEPSLLSFLNLHPTSQVTTNAVDMATGDLKEQVHTSTSAKSPKPPGSSRKSGKASAAAQTQSVRTLRSGTMSRRVAGGTGGRILKKRTREIPNNILAKPLDVTSYFRVVSANLVRNRVTEKSFRNIRETINPLLSEAYEGGHSLIPPRSKRHSF